MLMNNVIITFFNFSEENGNLKIFFPRAFIFLDLTFVSFSTSLIIFLDPKNHRSELRLFKF